MKPMQLTTIEELKKTKPALLREIVLIQQKEIQRLMTEAHINAIKAPRAKDKPKSNASYTNNVKVSYNASMSLERAIIRSGLWRVLSWMSALSGIDERERREGLDILADLVNKLEEN